MAISHVRSEFNLLDYWKVLVRRKWIIGTFSLLVILTTVVGTSRQNKAYLAKTVLHIDMTPPRVVDWDDSGDIRPRLAEFQPFYNTQYQIINSYTVKAHTIRKLREKGYTDWDGFADPVAAFSRSMRVDLIKDTRLVEIGYIHTDPDKATEIANTIAQVYIEENLNRKLNSTRFAEDWLTKQTLGWKEKKRESDLRLLDYMNKNGLVYMEASEEVFRDHLIQVHGTYNKARSERVVAESEYNTLLEMYKNNDLDALITLFATDAIRSLQEQLNTLERTYSSMSQRYLPKFPQMIRLESERDMVRQKLEEEVKKQLDGKEAEYLLARNREASLLQELEEAKRAAADLETKLVEVNALVAESKRNEMFFKQLDERQTEVDLVGLLKNSNIEVIDEAVPPVRPIRPNLTLNMLLALLVSATGGVGLAFGIEFLDRTFKSPDEIEHYLEIQLLGIFPSVPQEDDPSVKRDTYVFRNPKSSVAECCRAIRTNITLGVPGRRLRSMLVTSASPREGKSTLVVSLGITMALANNRTLLADTDLRRPRLHNVFDRDSEKGLTTLYEKTSDYEDSIFATEVPNLYILPAGPIPSNPAEILGSQRMKEIVRELEERFDIIIFDSPPCIAVTDAVVLSTSMDGVVLIIKQDSTTKDAAVEAKRRLTEVSDKLIGCIMNNIDVDRDNYGYRYYYYYYHYYQDDDSQPADRGKKEVAR